MLALYTPRLTSFHVFAFERLHYACYRANEVRLQLDLAEYLIELGLETLERALGQLTDGVERG